MLSIQLPLLVFFVVDVAGNILKALDAGDTINLKDPVFKDFSIRAYTEPTPELSGSVKFWLNGQFFRVENVAPYAFNGDNNGIYNPWRPNPWTYTLLAIPSARHLGRDYPGTPLEIRFTIISESLEPPQYVESFSLVDERTNLVVQEFENDSLTIDLANPDHIHWAFRANTVPARVGSVDFVHDNILGYLVNTFPYQTPIAYRDFGTHTVVAKVYSEPNAQGIKGIERKATVTIISTASLSVDNFDILSSSGSLIGRLEEGDEINVADPLYKSMTIVANTSGQVGSVKFDLNNQFYRTENVPPYTITGDQNGYFNPWVPQPGNYTLTGTPYAASYASGSAGSSGTIHFKVVNNSHKGSTARVATPDTESNLEKNGFSALTLYPVPVGDQLNVIVENDSLENASIAILNVHGLVFYKDTYIRPLTIDTADFKPGVYFLQVVGEGGYRQVTKFIKN